MILMVLIARVLRPSEDVDALESDNNQFLEVDNEKLTRLGIHC